MNYDFEEMKAEKLTEDGDFLGPRATPEDPIVYTLLASPF